MRSGARKFITAVAATAALGAGLGAASSAAAAEPAPASTHASTVQPHVGWHYDIAYGDLGACKATGAVYVMFNKARDYACEGPYRVPTQGGYEDLWELWLYY